MHLQPQNSPLSPLLLSTNLVVVKVGHTIEVASVTREHAAGVLVAVARVRLSDVCCGKQAQGRTVREKNDRVSTGRAASNQKP